MVRLVPLDEQAECREVRLLILIALCEDRQATSYLDGAVEVNFILDRQVRMEILFGSSESQHLAQSIGFAAPEPSGKVFAFRRAM